MVYMFWVSEYSSMPVESCAQRESWPKSNFVGQNAAHHSRDPRHERSARGDVDKVGVCQVLAAVRPLSQVRDYVSHEVTGKHDELIVSFSMLHYE